jgi:4-aminobutyrate aminotransferase-like enzyme
VTQASDLSSRITDDSSGNAVIDLGSGNQVTVVGVSSSDITASISTYIEIV